MSISSLPIIFQKSNLYTNLFNIANNNPKITIQTAYKTQNYTLQLPPNLNLPDGYMLGKKGNNITPISLIERNITTANRLLIANPDIGSLVYDTDLNQELYYNGTTWINVSGSPPITEFDSSVFRIFNNTDTTKKIAFNSSLIAPITTRTITMPNNDVNLADILTIQTNLAGFSSELKNLTVSEIQQLENIGANTISNIQWGYLSNMDQNISTGSSPAFSTINIADTSFFITNSTKTLIFDIAAVNGIKTITMPDSDVNLGDISSLQIDLNGFPDELKNLTIAEIQQLENINTTPLTVSNWNYLTLLDQNVATSNLPTWIQPISNLGFNLGMGGVQTIYCPSTLPMDYTITLPNTLPTNTSRIIGNGTNTLSYAEDSQYISNINLYKYPATHIITGGGLALKNAILANGGGSGPTSPRVYEINDSLTYTAGINITGMSYIVIRGAVGKRPTILCDAGNVYGFLVQYSVAGSQSTDYIMIGNMDGNIVGNTDQQGFLRIYKYLAATNQTVSNISIKDVFIYCTDYTTAISTYGVMVRSEIMADARWATNYYVEDCRFKNLKNRTDRSCIYGMGVENYIGARNSVSAPDLAGAASQVTQVSPYLFSASSGKEYYSTITTSHKSQWSTAGQACCARVILDTFSLQGRAQPIDFQFYGCTFANCTIASTDANNGSLRLTYAPTATSTKSYTIRVLKCKFVNSSYTGISLHGAALAPPPPGMSLTVTDSSFENIPNPIRQDTNYTVGFPYIRIERNTFIGCGLPLTGFTNSTLYNTGIAQMNGIYLRETKSILSDPSVANAAQIGFNPIYNQSNASTITRHNYMWINNITGTATVTDAPIFKFNADPGIHKAVDSGSIKASPGSVDSWLKININGTIYYIPNYQSKTT
jgi:hypothetical protein